MGRAGNQKLTVRSEGRRSVVGTVGAMWRRLVGQPRSSSHAQTRRREAEKTRVEAQGPYGLRDAGRRGGAAGQMVFGLWVLVQAAGASAALSVKVEPETVEVAQPVTVTIVNDGGAVVWPAWDPALPGWEVEPVSVTDTEARLTLRSWLPGDVAVPAITATTAGGVRFTTEPQTVTVTSVLPEDTDVADAGTLRDAAGALPVPSPPAPGRSLVAGGVTGALVLGGGILLLRKLAGPRAAARKKYVDQLVSQAVRDGDVALASAAVRQSVEHQLGIEASRQTTEELTTDQRLLGTLGGPLHQELIVLLRRMDGIRYAKASDDPRAAAADAGKIIRGLRDVAARERARGGSA